MSKIAIVYFSGTGNTKAMADAVEEGIKKQGSEADVIDCTEFEISKVSNYDAFAFGCPSYGSEELEETMFAPMWESVKGELGNKKVVLFGSYGWGTGEWMESWKEDAKELNVVDTYICNETPDDQAIEECINLGQKLIS